MGLRIWQLLYTTTVALAVSLAVSSGARAAWSDDNVDAAISAPYNGNVAAVSGTCPGASISLYGADGTLRWTAGGGPSDTYDPFCVARVVADSAGNLYVPGVVASTTGSSTPSYVLLSYAQDGTQRWVAPLQVRPETVGLIQPPAIAVGADGNVYLLAGSTPYDPSMDHILGFAASDGHQILDVPLGVSWPLDAVLTYSLSASTDGLTVTANEVYRLYGYDGTLKADSTVTDAPLIGHETTIAGGSQSLLLSESSGLVTSCGQLTPVPQQFSVTEQGPSGTVWQATSASTTAPCLSWLTFYFRSTPDGGAVITGDPSTGVGGDHLAEFDNQGHVRWDIPINDPSLSDEAIRDVRVTTAGEVVLFQGAMAPCVGVSDQISCHEVIITFHSPSDGSQTRPAIVLSDPSSNYANTTPDLQYAPLVLPNRIVVHLYGAAPDVIGPQYPVLQSLDVGGLAGDYQTLLETPTGTPTQGSGPGSVTGGGSAGTGIGGSGSPPASGAPIVLVPGINNSAGTVTPSDSSCKAAGDLTYLCAQLRYLGHAVYVVGASPGGARRKPDELNSLGDLDANAVVLSSFLKGTVRTPALLAGYSMGGLIARIAISRYGASAAGLFTIGTPHDGSFLLDIAGGIELGCFTANPTMCALWGILAKVFPASTSTAAHEMTFIARYREKLPTPTVPIWTVAGTELASGAPPSYLVPNDIAVGETSAHGLTANLGCQQGEPNLRLYHIDPFSLHIGPVSLGLAFKTLLPPAGNELNSPDVAALVGHADNEVSRGPCVVKASRAGAAIAQAEAARSTAPNNVIRYEVKLMTARVGAKARQIPVTGLVVTDKPFHIFCGKTPLSPIVLPGDLFAFEPADAACTHPTVTPPLHGSIAVTSDPAALRASVSIHGNHATIVLRSGRAVQAAVLRLGHRVLRLRRASKRQWRLALKIDSNVPQVLTARCGGQAYAALLSL